MTEGAFTVPGHPRISKTPGVCGADACIRNTRIMVWLLEAMRRKGASDGFILKSYPQLDQKDVEASRRYVAEFPDEIHEALQENSDV